MSTLLLKPIQVSSTFTVKHEITQKMYVYVLKYRQTGIIRQLSPLMRIRAAALYPSHRATPVTEA